MFSRAVNKIIGFVLRLPQALTDYVKTYIKMFPERYTLSSARLVDAAKLSDKKVISAKINLVEGSHCIVIPSPEINQSTIAKVLNGLDQAPNGRAGYNGFNTLTGGNFLLADTTPLARIHRRAIVKYLSPNDFIATTQQIFHDYLKSSNLYTRTHFNLMDASYLVQRILAQHILGIDTLSDDWRGMLLHRKNAMLMSSRSSLIQYLMSFYKDFDENNKKFQTHAKCIIDSQRLKILNIFHQYPEAKSNLIADTVIEFIIQKHPDFSSDIQSLKKYLHKITMGDLDNYLSQPYFLTLPLISTAGDNLEKVLQGALNMLDRFSVDDNIEEYFRDLHNEIKSAWLFDEEGNIQTEKLRNLKHLDAWYKECLRMYTSSQEIFRYTDQAIELDGENTIPAHSMIAFRIGMAQKESSQWEKPHNFSPMRFFDNTQHELHKYPFIPFSTGNRSCPGSKMAEIIFKTVIICAMNQFDFTLRNKAERERKASAVESLNEPAFNYRSLMITP